MYEKKRYLELTPEFECHQISKHNLDSHARKVYIEMLYIPELDIRCIKNVCEPPKDIDIIKRVLLPGYAYIEETKLQDILIVEYLDFDGYLVTKTFNEYDYPRLYKRYP